MRLTDIVNEVADRLVVQLSATIATARSLTPGYVKEIETALTSLKKCLPGKPSLRYYTIEKSFNIFQLDTN